MNNNLDNNKMETNIKRKLILSNNITLDTEFCSKNKFPNEKKKIELTTLNLNLDNNLPLIFVNSNMSSKSNKSIFNHINNKTEIDNIKKIENIYFNGSSTERKTPIKTKTIEPSKNDLIKISINENIPLLKSKEMTSNKMKPSKIQLEDMAKKQKNITKSTKTIFPKNLNFITDGGIKNKNKIYKIQKNQFKKTKTNLENNYNKNPDLKIFSENMQIAYSKKYENTVFNHIKQINQYRYRKDLEINPLEDDYYDFISKNKLLKKSNILIKLMKSEQKKLQTNYTLHSEKIKSNKKKLSKDEKNFEELKEKQKNLCKKFEYMHTHIYEKNHELIQEEIENHYIIKNNQDEVRRILHKIDELRVYGYFVNEVLGGDTTRFEKKIIPEDKYEEEIDYPLISRNVLKKYNYFLLGSPFDDGKIIYDKDLFTKENSFINEPEKMWFKFKEIENIIVRNVFIKEKIKNDIKGMIEDKNYNLKDLKQRKELLEAEYKNLKENINYETLKFQEIEKRYITYKIEIGEIVNDLYKYCRKEFNNYNFVNKNFELYDTFDTTKEIHRMIQSSEILLDNLAFGLKKLQNEDSKLFDSILDNRKKYLKLLKSQQILNQKIREKFNFILDVSTYNKIVFKSRKTEAPYQKKKKVEKVEIDKSLKERLENEEMLTYEKGDDE